MNVILANAELQKEFIGYVMQKTSTAFLFIANLDIFFTAIHMLYNYFKFSKVEDLGCVMPLFVLVTYAIYCSSIGVDEALFYSLLSIASLSATHSFLTIWND
ncbi:hypothetical protein [Ruminococcus intestinalis]|uniref:hypothetical protein n=1 Tax=Ruminococcus intestinalis TaxID=2763066 RepID=UPI003F80DF0E